MSRLPRRTRYSVAIAGILLLAACGGESDAGSIVSDESLPVSTTTTAAPPSTTTSTSTTLPAPVGPFAPLTGLSVEDGVVLDRPAIAVKIDNHPKARPQVGLQDADLVFDLRAEGVTRFMAVFHSAVPSAVGPVRSSRTSDLDLLRGLHHPLYASSGGNSYVMNAVASVPVYALTNQTRREYYRDSSRPAPHNLFIDPNVLYAALGDAWIDDGNPEPWFTYRSATDTLPASAVAAIGPVTIDFKGSPTVAFEWDAGIGGWRRSQDGAAHKTADGEQIAPENVVILVTTYTTSAADAGSPEVRSTGEGEALVLTDGHIIAGSWSRPDAAQPPVVLDAAGDTIALTPGQTWVLYPEAGQITR